MPSQELCGFAMALEMALLNGWPDLRNDCNRCSELIV